MSDKQRTWEVNAAEDVQEVYVCSQPTAEKRRRTICLLPASSHTTRDETIADARLIAAAPGLLAACEELLKSHMGQLDPNYDWLGLMDQGTAAIAKAKAK